MRISKLHASPLYWAEYSMWRCSNKFRQRQRTASLRAVGIRQNFFPKLGLVFVHIPKTAGTTLHEYFSKLEDSCTRRSSSYDSIETLRQRLSTESKHLEASFYREAAGAEAWRSIYSFTLVRNPGDIMVSTYHWWLEKAPSFNNHLASALRVRRMAGFEEFLDSDLALAGDTGLPQPLENWFRLGGQDIVTHIGLFEALQKELDELRGKLNQQTTDITIAHRNRSARSPYQPYYTPRMRDKVADRFRYVIDRFEYAF